MKAILAFAFASVSVSAFACPNFAGQYFCTNHTDNTKYDLTITQTDKQMTWIDEEGTNGPFYLNGTHVSMTNIFPIQYSSKCSGNKLSMEIVMPVVADGDDETVTIHMEKTATGLVGTGLGSSPISGGTCVKK